MTNNFLDELNDNGYGVIKGAFDKEEVKKISEIIEIKFSDYLKEKSPQYIFYNPFTIDHFFYKLILNEKINHLNKLYLGGDYILNAQALTMSIKCDELNSFYEVTKIHSDYPGDFKLESVQQLAYMLCIDCFEADNGSTQFYPGSHLKNKNDIHKNQISPVSAEAEPGDLIVWFGSTWHKVGENLAGKRRIGITQRYTSWFVKQMFDYPKYAEAQIKDKDLKKIFGSYAVPPKVGGKEIFTLKRSLY